LKLFQHFLWLLALVFSSPTRWRPLGPETLGGARRIDTFGIVGRA